MHKGKGKQCVLNQPGTKKKPKNKSTKKGSKPYGY